MVTIGLMRIIPEVRFPPGFCFEVRYGNSERIFSCKLQKVKMKFMYASTRIGYIFQNLATPYETGNSCRGGKNILDYQNPL